MTKKPLNSLTDLELISLVRNDSSNEAFNVICEKYQDVFYKICQKYNLALASRGINTKDIFDEKNYIIYNCVLSFDQTRKTKLSSYIGNYARYLCLNSLNARKYILPSNNEEVTRFLEENQIKNDFDHRNHFKEQSKYVFNILGQVKDQRIKEIFNYRYGDSKKMIWSKIGKKMGISVQTAVNLHQKGLILVQKKFKSENISDVI
jgi:RNA polymerase sigma factor (sigma-70 family)